MVNSRNNAMLNEIEGELYTITCTSSSRIIKNFKPTVDKAGCISNTPFQAVLQLKKGAEVILIHNISVVDGLCNGSRGVLLDVVKREEKVKKLVIKFHNPQHGIKQREKMPCHRYKEGTYIEPVLWQYYLGSSTATVYQFPVKMAAAITAHKIQGQTVSKPNSLVVDIQTTFKPGMVYVMLSRVCSLQQLFILEKLQPEKIKVCPLVLKEYERMNKVCVNNNPTSWSDITVKGIRVSSLNVRSLRKHLEDVRLDNVLQQSDIICLQETWLEGETLELKGYLSYFNSQGRGKGTVVYIKEGESNNIQNEHHVQMVTSPYLQLTKLSTNTLDIVNIYRSQEESFNSVKRHLQDLLNINKNTLIIGDFNFCYLEKTNNLRNYLDEQGFSQLVSNATHINGGLLDQVYIRQVEGINGAMVKQMSNYYSDHDTITVHIQQEEQEHE